MFDINRCHFIFKQSSGRTISIFHKEAAGICLSTLNKKGIWNTPSVILRNALPEFYAYLDSDDFIHILSQDSGSLITYSHFNGKAWKAIPVTAGRHALQGVRYLWTGGFDKNLFLLYTADYPGSSFLYFQQGGTNGSLQEPMALDGIDADSAAFRIAAGKYGELCVFYMQKSPSGRTAGFRTLKAPAGGWSEFISFRDEAANTKLDAVSACYGSDGSLHLLYSKAEGTRHELYHARNAEGEGVWHKDEFIAESDRPFTNTALIALDRLLAVYWVNDGRIYCRTSDDSGYSWNKAEEYAFPDSKHLYCISYSSNEPGDQAPKQCPALPGSYSGGYRLALLKELMGKTESAAQLRTAEPNINYSHVVAEIDRLFTLYSQIEAELAGFKADLSALKKMTKAFAEQERQQASETKQSAAEERQPAAEEKQSAVEERQPAAQEKQPAAWEKPMCNAKPEPELAEIVEITKAAPVKKPVRKQAASRPPISPNIPLMPGTGFSFITPEFLDNLKKKT